MEMSLTYIGRTEINQEQFTQLYNRLLKIAYYKAGRYFRDEILRQDAADKAMNDATDKWIAEDCYNEELALRTIESSLRQSSRKRTLEPISLTNEEREIIGSDGIHGYLGKETE